MATVNIRSDLYERLACQAALHQTTVEDFVAPALERLVELTPPSHERRAALDEWLELIQKRANRYPPEFVVDDSRDTIYEGRDE